MSKHTVQDLVFVGGGGRVVALDRYDGSVVWKWKAPRGSGFLAALSPISYVSVALDGDRLIVASRRGTWCLDPVTGAEVWETLDATFNASSYPVVASGAAGANSAASAASGAATAAATAAAAAAATAAATAAASSG